MYNGHIKEQKPNKEKIERVILKELQEHVTNVMLVEYLSLFLHDKLDLTAGVVSKFFYPTHKLVYGKG